MDAFALINAARSVRYSNKEINAAIIDCIMQADVRTLRGIAQELLADPQTPMQIIIAIMWRAAHNESLRSFVDKNLALDANAKKALSFIHAALDSTLQESALSLVDFVQVNFPRAYRNIFERPIADALGIGT